MWIRRARGKFHPRRASGIQSGKDLEGPEVMKVIEDPVWRADPACLGGERRSKFAIQKIRFTLAIKGGEEDALAVGGDIKTGHDEVRQDPLGPAGFQLRRPQLAVFITARRAATHQIEELRSIGRKYRSSVLKLIRQGPESL